MDKLADVYRLENRFAEAEPLFLKVLEMRRRILGPENPYNTATMINLANLYIATARHGEAESLLKQVVDVGRRLNGEPIPTL
jgi:tetratricopeptide (TPR) repeat protein